MRGNSAEEDAGVLGCGMPGWVGPSIEEEGSFLSFEKGVSGSAILRGLVMGKKEVCANSIEKRTRKKKPQDPEACPKTTATPKERSQSILSKGGRKIQKRRKRDGQPAEERESRRKSQQSGQIGFKGKVGGERKRGEE